MLLITAHNEYCIHLLQNKQNYYCVSVSILNRFMSTKLSLNHSQSQPTLARTTANHSQPQLEQQPIVANLSQNNSQSQPTLARVSSRADRVCQALKQKKTFQVETVTRLSVTQTKVVHFDREQLNVQLYHLKPKKTIKNVSKNKYIQIYIDIQR